MTQIWILNNAVFDPVNIVALLQNFVMNEASPDRWLDEIGGRRRSGDWKEACSPCYQIVEIKSGRACDNAIKVCGILLGAADSLSASLRTAKKIRSCMWFLIE